jgi:hypothetical protein
MRSAQFVLAIGVLAAVFAASARNDGKAHAGGFIVPPTYQRWITRSYDPTRSSANLNETYLTQANVNNANFGVRNYFEVDDQIDAQPLYLAQFPNVSGNRVNFL